MTCNNCYQECFAISLCTLGITAASALAPRCNLVLELAHVALVIEQSDRGQILVYGHLTGGLPDADADAHSFGFLPKLPNCTPCFKCSVQS